MGESAELARFRSEVRAFLRESIPPDILSKVREGFDLAKPDQQRWNLILDQKGWAVPNWPIEHGGTGWTPLQRHIFNEECGRGDAPGLSGFGINLVGPILIRFGSREQQRRYLPAIRSGREYWCQGFSEPNAGSDLLSLVTRADRHGDGWVLNGRKIWTTQAHKADRMFALVRTERGSTGANGLTLLLVDMNDPGVSVRPIVTIDRAHHTNEVVLEDVKVARSDQVGEAGKGWEYARALLQNERASSAHLPRAERHLRRLIRAAKAPGCDGGRPIDDPAFAAAMAEAILLLRALQSAVMTVIGDAPEARKRGLASVIKLRGSELGQLLTRLTVRALGPRSIRYWPDPSWPAAFDAGLPDEYDEPAAMGDHLLLRAATIYGGSSEVQRNLIARLALKGWPQC